MNTYEESPLFRGRKGTVFTSVVLLHVAFVFALYTELAGPMGAAIKPQPLVLVPMTETIKPSVKSPPLTPLIDRMRFYFTPPEIPPITPEDDASATTITATRATEQVVPQPPSQPAARIPVRMDPKHPLRIAEDYYPDASRRANETGRCMVQATVAVDGRIIAAALQSSTGYERLDQACIQGVRGQRMLPATEGGKPIESTVSIPITWNLSEK
jgi:protein TonB